MRENSLKKIAKYSLLTLSLQLSGCVYSDLRPNSLQQNQYPQQYRYIQQQPEQVKTENNISIGTPIQTQTPLSSKPKEEDVILEEIYIPSALQNTPIDEIEILSETQQIPEIEPNTQIVKTESKPKIQPIELKKVKVKQSDTLYSIAKANDIKVYELAEHNNLKSPFTLKPGQILEIPTKTPTEEKKTPVIMNNLDEEKTFIEEPKKDFIIIKKGDTIYSIAKQNNVPLKELILRNNLKAPFTLSIGQKIYIPNSAFHIVKAKDTIYSISKKYNVSLNSLVKLNKLSDPYTLLIGQKILLPSTNTKMTQKQKKIIVKDKETSKIIKPSSEQNTTKEISSVRVAKKEKIQIVEKVKIQETPEQKEKIEKIIIKPEPLTSKRFKWPVKGKIISEYGIKSNGKRNDGINISAKLGTPVSACENGIVAYAGNELKGLGNLIIIRHDKNFVSIYAHNDSLLVKRGQTIKRGEQIATVGKSGRVTTPQLHFEIREKEQALDPIDVLERR